MSHSITKEELPNTSVVDGLLAPSSHAILGRVNTQSANIFILFDGSRFDTTARGGSFVVNLKCPVYEASVSSLNKERVID